MTEVLNSAHRSSSTVRLKHPSKGTITKYTFWLLRNTFKLSSNKYLSTNFLVPISWYFFLSPFHWLPISFRLYFKNLLITFTALHGLALSYIAQLLLPYGPECSLRPSDKALLAVQSSPSSKGDWASTVRTLELWNSLPEDLRLTESVTSLASPLKTCFLKKYFF